MNVKICLLTVMMFGFIQLSMTGVNGASFSTTQSGAWNNPATWGGGGFPTGCFSDDVTINNTHTVTLTADACTGSYTVNAGGTLQLDGRTLSVGGHNVTLTNNGTITSTLGGAIFCSNGGANQTLAGNGDWGARFSFINNNVNWSVAAGTVFDYVENPQSIVHIQINASGNLTANNVLTITTLTAGNPVVFENLGSANGTAGISVGGVAWILGTANIDFPIEVVGADIQGWGVYRRGLTITNGGMFTLRGALSTSNLAGGTNTVNINTGGEVRLGGFQLNVLWTGNTFTNNGTIRNSIGAGSNIVFADNGSHTIAGNGNYTGPVTVEIFNATTSIASGSSLRFSNSDTLTNLLVQSGANLVFNGPGSLTFDGPVTNNGQMRFNEGQHTCALANRITIRSALPGTQIAWGGTGSYPFMRNLDVQDQAGTAAITVQGGLNSGNNGANWTFTGQCVTAGEVEVSGRIMSGPGGRGLTNARVTLTDSAGEMSSVITGRGGTFSFTNVASGRTYVLSVGSQRFTFLPRVLEVNDAITDLSIHPDR